MYTLFIIPVRTYLYRDPDLYLLCQQLTSLADAEQLGEPSSSQPAARQKEVPAPLDHRACYGSEERI